MSLSSATLFLAIHSRSLLGFFILLPYPDPFALSSAQRVFRGGGGRPESPPDLALRQSPHHPVGGTSHVRPTTLRRRVATIFSSAFDQEACCPFDWSRLLLARCPGHSVRRNSGVVCWGLQGCRLLVAGYWPSLLTFRRSVRRGFRWSSWLHSPSPFVNHNHLRLGFRWRNTKDIFNRQKF